MFAVLFLLYWVAALPAAEIRYDDVLYLDEAKQPVLRLKALARTPLTSSRDPDSVIAYLAEGQPVEIIGLGEMQHYVAARTATGAARGWVDARALEAPPAELLAKLQARREREQAHRELIERHEVAESMTRGEVQASLGKPEHISRQHTKEGDEEQWFYTMYKYLPYYVKSPDSDGQFRQVVSYRRETVGHRVITFRNDEVVAIDEQQDEKANSSSVVASPPIPVNH